MSPEGVASLVAAMGELALFVLAVRRAPRSALAFPLALLCVALFSWSFCSFSFELTRQPEWRLLSAAAFPVSVAIAMHSVLSFVGRRRSLAWLMFTHYGVFGPYSAMGLLALRVPTVARWVLSPEWIELFALLALPPFAIAIVLLLAHRSRASGTEQERTNLLLLALAWSALLSLTQLGAATGYDVPRLGPIGALGATFALAFVVLRLKLRGFEPSAGGVLYAVMLAALALLVDVAVMRLFRKNGALVIASTLSVTLTLLALWQRFVATRAQRQERISHLATLGRFSAQMAHDLKNPLAALRGAAQFLKEEHARGQSLQDKGEFFELLVDQVDRLERVIDRYQRLGRVEPVRHETDLEALVERVVKLGRTRPGGAEIRCELAGGLPAIQLDVDLISNALENLLRNAAEAMPRGGTITVRTGQESEQELFVSVEDTGEGMDARTRERAFDDFFTTKSAGSGLGLAFVRRVMEAHGGSVQLSSGEGRGTTVRLMFTLE